jgi:glycosyltransferase involved in cell wall biosynthesis
MTPLKVVHIITRLDWGGSAQNTMLTVMGHDRRRFKPVVIAGTASASDAQGGIAATEANRRRLESAGIRCHLLPVLQRSVSPLADLRGLIGLIRLLRAESPNLVHTHTSKAGILGRLAAWLARIPVIVHTPHGHVFYGHFGPIATWFFLQLERLWAHGTNRLVALTSAERDDHVSRGVGRPERFPVIPSGIDLEAYWSVPEGRAAPPSDAEDLGPGPVIGSVGWLTPVKGHRVLIEATARLKTSHPDLHTIILGSGPLLQELRALSAQLGVADSVHFLGMRANIPAWLAAMDVFVLPSLNEGMGRALIEAMAAARPVVASCVGGVPGILHDRQNGRLVPAGNSAKLAEVLAELLAHPADAWELGTAARKSIDARFGVRAMVFAVEAIYEEALAERPGGV